MTHSTTHQMTSLPQPNVERLTKTLFELLAIDSPTGDTAAMETHLEQRLAAFDVTLQRTQRGQVLAATGANPKRALAAHVDTLGAMVQAIRPDGRLELTPLGTWSARFAEGGRVTVKTDHGPIRGTVLPQLASGHAYNEAVDQQPVGWSQLALRLDIDSQTAAQTLAAGVLPGDIVCFDAQPELSNGFINSRFLDNKASIACTLEMLALLHEAGVKPASPILLAYTNAEEIGLGAGTALPAGLESLISLDIAPVAPNQTSRETAITLGMKDSLGPHSRSLLAELEQLCQAHQLPYVRDVFRHYHSDCSSALHAGHDLRTALVGFGTDATHGYERTHLDSLVALCRWLVAYALADNVDNE
ncbi:M20/M25/M40 family metallo-hydrolase [Saccharospirillum mangrovi]|uniref:M20/M25/M40 family metallo-hydrolase n=1 Tax=Saccharospirillum mangrovi TaxID=2161747 RepID=UPI000D393546|nr:M20/M25/M40 family metallo-hydrolase [Saccharospirillum mangrovi]